MYAQPPGTMTRRVIAWWQWILMIFFFIAPVVLYSLFMAQFGADLENYESAIWIFLGIMTVSVGFGIWIAYKPKGDERLWITDVDGVRGEFKLRRPLLISMLPFCAMVTGVTIALLLEDEHVTDREFTGIIIVLLIFTLLPIILLLSGIYRFRIDEHGGLSYRTLLAWHPFEITDYRRIQNGIMTGRYGGEIPVAVKFRKPIPGKRALRLNLMWVQSVDYKTTVPVTAIDDYFRRRCEQAGYTMKVKEKSVRWQADKKDA